MAPFPAVWSRQLILVLDGAARTPLILVPICASWSDSSCGRCQFEGIWQVALLDSRVVYGFQMGLRHPSTVPVRQSGSLYPIWKTKESNITELNNYYLKITGLGKLYNHWNITQSNCTFCRGMMEMTVYGTYGHCFVGALEWHQLCLATAHQAAGQQKLGYTASVENL